MTAPANARCNTPRRPHNQQQCDLPATHEGRHHFVAPAQHTPSCGNCGVEFKGSNIRRIVLCTLHAAAPELLAALEAVWPILAALPVGPIGRDEPKINQARTAIRKAKGE